MYCAYRPVLQVSCLWHDIPLCILTSDILSNAFPLEDEGKLDCLDSPFAPFWSIWKGHTASLGYLTLTIIGGTAFVFGLNWTFKSSPDQMLPDVGFGPTTWTYHLGLYFAPWNRFQPYLVITITRYEPKMGRCPSTPGWSFPWIRSPPHTWKGCQSEPSCQPASLAGERKVFKTFRSAWIRSRSSLPLPLSMVCTTLDVGKRRPFSWQQPTTLSRFKTSLSPSFYFCRDWPGVWLFPGSSLLAQRYFQIPKNSIFDILLMRLQGYGGPVNDFLAWPVFAPLSRLTYCCYLIHMEILLMFGLSVLSYPHDVRSTWTWSSNAMMHQLPRSPCWVWWCTSSGDFWSPSARQPYSSLPLKLLSHALKRFWWGVFCFHFHNT